MTVLDPAIRKSNNVISVSSVRRFGKDCWRIRLKEEKQIQDAIPENVATEKDHVISNTDIPETKKARPEPEVVISFLKKKNVKFIDKRDRNGALWIVGGKELSPIINECKKFGVFFHFKEDGGRQTDFRPGWWAK